MDQFNNTLINPAASLRGRKYHTVLADPPSRFTNRTGKVAPEHRRLTRYETMTTVDICRLPIADVVSDPANLYMWVPNALLPDGLAVLKAWGFDYKSNIVWHKIRKDGGSDGRGVGFYFRNVTEILLFGVRGRNARTLAPGRRQVNMIQTRMREHSRKPDEQYQLIESCSKGPYLELFARGTRPGWSYWGDQANDAYRPTWEIYAHNSATAPVAAEQAAAALAELRHPTRAVAPAARGLRLVVLRAFMVNPVLSRLAKPAQLIGYQVDGHYRYQQGDAGEYADPVFSGHHVVEAVSDQQA